MAQPPTQVSAHIYLFSWRLKFVVSDIDGTITRSDVLGHLLPQLGMDWTHHGITELYHHLAEHGYQILFLSSRSIGQAEYTRAFLASILQSDFRMPVGPVIISPFGILPALYKEMVLRRPHEFKIQALQARGGENGAHHACKRSTFAQIAYG